MSLRTANCLPNFACLAAWLLAIFTSLVAAAAEPNTLTGDELTEGWVLLFDGRTTYGWQAGSEANWSVKDGVIRVSDGQPGLLSTTCEFADYELLVDFRAPATTNSGVFLRTPGVPSDPKSDCYELNIASPELSPFPTGSFVGRQKSNSYEASEDWQTFHVRAVGGRFEVRLNGDVVLDYTDAKPLGRGHIGLQFNHGAVEFRNVKLKPLGTQSLFNGRDLSGWKSYPDLASVFTVSPSGDINVKDGRGMLETEAQFADFVLQFEVYSNGEQLNSGMFFRSIPGDLMNGYECQVHNGFKDNDRTQPVDCGTGGFYRRQDARMVNSNDFEWTYLTLVAHGPHMAAWVNGVQVSDWTDTRAPHDNPRNGLRLEAGTLIIQGHDPTTDLSFRNLRAVELAPRQTPK